MNRSSTNTIYFDVRVETLVVVITRQVRSPKSGCDCRNAPVPTRVVTD